MALEFVTTDQTATYNVDAGDEVFVTAGTEFRVSDAFDFADFGTMEVYIAGDMYIGDDVLDDSFTNVAAVDLFFNFAASSTSLIAGDAFVLTADASVTSEFHSVNAGDITVGETFIFAQNFDQVSFSNSGTLTGLSTNTQSLVSNLGLTTDFNFSNTGTIQTVGNTAIIGAAMGNAMIVNHGTMTAGTGLALNMSGNASSAFTIENTGQISGQIATTGATSLSNSGTLNGDLTVSNYEDTVSNSADIYGDVSLRTGSDVLTNTGTIHGTVFTGTGSDTIANSGVISGGVDAGSGTLVFSNTGDVFEDVSGGSSSDFFFNWGVIRGNLDTGGGTDVIRNFGSVDGAVFIYDTNLLFNVGTIGGGVFGTAGAETVINAGYILGGENFVQSVDLEGGDDSFTMTDTGDVTGGVVGGSGNDTLIGNARDNTFDGEADNDTLLGKQGEDTLTGGSGEDTLRGGAGNDTLFGDDDNDTLKGGDGDDALNGGNNNDVLYGMKGEDELIGGNGSDDLFGGMGNDILLGGGSKDDLFGDQGDDILEGGAAADTLTGGRGDDTLTGGDGPDTFIFSLQNGNDIVTDFEDGSDLLDFSAFNIASGADLKTGGTDTAAGYLIDLTTFGGSGTVLIQGITEADIGPADLIL